MTMDDRRDIRLCSKGQKWAFQRDERYRFFIKKFSQRSVPIEIAERDACSIGPMIGEETCEVLKRAFDGEQFRNRQSEI